MRGDLTLTGAVRRSGRRSLNDRCAVSGQAPGSGAQRRNQVLDEVSTAILGGEAAENVSFTSRAGKTDECNKNTINYG